jgi:hypothetical protein
MYFFPYLFEDEAQSILKRYHGETKDHVCSNYLPHVIKNACQLHRYNQYYYYDNVQCVH